jgi:hypothetical protein
MGEEVVLMRVYAHAHTHTHTLVGVGHKASITSWSISLLRCTRRRDLSIWVGLMRFRIVHTVTHWRRVSVMSRCKSKPRSRGGGHGVCSCTRGCAVDACRPTQEIVCECVYRW